MVKKKVTLIIPSLRHGGSERVMSELANLWVQNESLQVDLILLTNNQKECYDIHKKVNVIRPTKSYEKNIFSKLFYKIWILFYLRKTCLKIGSEVVLTFGERYNNIVLLSLLFSKIKVYVSDRNSPFLNIGFVHNQLRNFLYKTAAGIIAQTDTAKEVLLEKTMNKNIKVIHNPLKQIENNSKERKKIVLNVGRNVKQKNQLELIDIFYSCNTNNDWTLKILGNGHLKQNLKQRVKELDIEDQVNIIDFVSNVDEFYNEASIFAFTSVREGFPNALLEAKAHGLACISYDCPTGPKELIDNNSNGFLVPLKDIEEFTRNLTLLMNSKDLREDFSKDKDLIKNKFSVDSIGQEYLNFICNANI